MNPLHAPLSFKTVGYHFELVQVDGCYAIYSQCKKGVVYAYEVHRLDAYMASRSPLSGPRSSKAAPEGAEARLGHSWLLTFSLHGGKVDALARAQARVRKLRRRKS